MPHVIRLLLSIYLSVCLYSICLADEGADELLPPESVRGMVQRFCIDCHNASDRAAGLDLDSISQLPIASRTMEWEKVVRKLRVRHMPPMDQPRPEEGEYETTLADLTSVLDRVAEARPWVGRTDSLRRLTRTEYQNAIRDLLDLRIDPDKLLPAEASSHGFDNVTVTGLSPTLMQRYLTAAQEISRLAVGRCGEGSVAETYRVRPDLTQEEHIAGLPIGTRGGTLIPLHFPRDGQYEIEVRLSRDRNEEVEGLKEPHTLEILLDRQQMAALRVEPPRGTRDHSQVDAHLKARFAATAGPHEIGVTFIRQTGALIETARQPYQAHFNMHRHPRLSPAVYQVSITGPFEPGGPGDTPPRRRIFARRPERDDDERDCARVNLSQLARRAWRGPVGTRDIDRLLGFFDEGRRGGDFELGMENALAAILVHPRFLFRIEQDPPGVKSGTIYRVSDFELASRLSFLLWSSIPDDELLALAEQGRLHEDAILEQQVRRMLADERASSLWTNFAGQWLQIRNLESAHPDMRLFPDFDDNLRQSMREETERLFARIVREDRSVLELLSSRETYLDERLARHYGIPHVIGSRFRPVTPDPALQRGGLLRHGSILTITSYATRTSPVLRGRWLLETLLGAPPPPPPANVPALEDNTVSASLPLRERLAQHRSNTQCASCHQLIDPPGFALEKFDAVGRRRELDAGWAIDDSGALPDGQELHGVTGLEQSLLRRPEWFLSTFAEKLLTFGVGRPLDPRDGPAIRRIVRHARREDDRFSAFVIALVRSQPFQMRTAE